MCPQLFVWHFAFRFEWQSNDCSIKSKLSHAKKKKILSEKKKILFSYPKCICSIYWALISGLRECTIPKGTLQKSVHTSPSNGSWAVYSNWTLLESKGAVLLLFHVVQWYLCGNGLLGKWVLALAITVEAKRGLQKLGAVSSCTYVLTERCLIGEDF